MTGRTRMTKVMLGRKAIPPIQIGDRYTKAGILFGTVWEVVRLWTAVDGLAHVRLVSLAPHRETIAVSAGTLKDRQFFLPVPRPPPEESPGE